MVNKFLKHATIPIEVWPEKKISELAKDMTMTGFQGKNLGLAVEIWARMLKKRNIVIWFGLTGAMVPAGMRRIVSYLIKRRMIDVVVSTGANLYHDCFEALGGKHYLGTHMIDDVKLRKNKIDRIYDVFANEHKVYEADLWIEKIFSPTLRNHYPYSSREILFQLGKMLKENEKVKDSILVNAYENNVPIFCPALGDSAIGYSIMFANRRRDKRIIVDQIKDVNESSGITEKTKQSGVVYIGGGTPKNFIQQTAVIAGYQTRHDRSHSYAIQITTDAPQWGGLSGCTFEEAQSWGKIRKNARMVACYCDATIALPIVAHALSDKFKRLTRNVPLIDFKNGDVKLSYEKMRV
jgi:deoxyhypusine synthase